MRSAPGTRALLRLLLLTAAAAAAAAAGALAGAPGAAAGDDRVYLPGVAALVFTAGALTRPRRGAPRTELSCVGGDAAGDADVQPVHVDCVNGGVSPRDGGGAEGAGLTVDWRCAAVPERREVKLQAWEVHCEGFSFPLDVFVVKGSCYLEYELSYRSGVAKKGAAKAPGEGAVEARGDDGASVGDGLWATVRIALLLCGMAALAAAAGKCGKAPAGGAPAASDPLLHNREPRR